MTELIALRPDLVPASDAAAVQEYLTAAEVSAA